MNGVIPPLLLQAWLAEKQLIWPEDVEEQQTLIAQFWEDGRRVAEEAPDRTWVVNHEGNHV